MHVSGSRTASRAAHQSKSRARHVPSGTLLAVTGGLAAPALAGGFAAMGLGGAVTTAATAATASTAAVGATFGAAGAGAGRARRGVAPPRREARPKMRLRLLKKKMLKSSSKKTVTSKN